MFNYICFIIECLVLFKDVIHFYEYVIIGFFLYVFNASGF
jgi:hypothetical protein